MTPEPGMPMEQRLMPYEAVREVARGSAIVFAPHADDETFGCAGAIMRHVDAGDAVTVIVVTDGAYGEGAQANASARKDECRAAARVLGYGLPQFWELPDRGVVFGERLVRDVLAAIEAENAEVVYAPSVFEMHPDHRAVGMAALEAVRRRGRGWLAMYEVGIAMRPNRLLDITDLVPRKDSAMQAYASQLAVQAYDRHIRGLNVFRTYTLSANVTAAEGYIVLDASELAGDPLGLYLSEHRRQRLLGLEMDSGNRPLVTVVVRHHGAAAGLERTLDSLALQTYPRIEVLVADQNAGAVDGGEQWCGRFPQHRLGAADCGSAAEASNRALEEAAGVYVAVLDSGSVLAPDHLEHLVALLEEREEAAGYAGARMEDNPGVVRNSPFDRGRLLGEAYIPLDAVLFGRRLIQAGCRFDPALGDDADNDFLVQLSEHTAFVHVDRVTATLSDAGGRTTGAALHAKWRGNSSPDAVAELAASRARLQDELDTQARMLAEERGRTDELRGENERLRREVDRMLRSRSWRLTAPLRGAASRLSLVIGFLRRREPGAP